MTGYDIPSYYYDPVLGYIPIPTEKHICSKCNSVKVMFVKRVKPFVRVFEPVEHRCWNCEVKWYSKVFYSVFKLMLAISTSRMR